MTGVLQPAQLPESVRNVVRLEFSRLSAQEKAHRAFVPGNRVCIPWGRGCGKSWFVRRMMYLLVARWDGEFRPGAPHPGVRIVVLMPTLEQARKVHTDLLLAELDGSFAEWGWLGAKINRSTWRITFPGGSWIQFVTAERAQFIRGIRADAVFIDEADDIDAGLVDAVVNPWFSEPHSLRQMLVAGTPRRGRGGLLYRAYAEWPKLARGRYFGFHATAYDGPTIIDPEYLAEVAKITPPDIFKREWLCDFDSAEGLVFPMFSPTFHVREPDPETVWDDVIIGADHGWEDPGVMLTIGILGRGREAQAWVIDEVYEQHRTPDWWIEKLRERLAWFPEAKWYPDPARADITASWRTEGARLRDVDKRAGSVENGVGVIQRFLHVRSRPAVGGGRLEYARLYVDPRCVNTINEFGLYRRKRSPRNTEVVLEELEDANNHAIDALRYAIVNHFELNHVGRVTGSLEARST